MTPGSLSVPNHPYKSVEALGEFSAARCKDSPLPQSWKQLQSSSSGGRKDSSSKLGRRRCRASRGRVLSGPPPPRPPETPGIFGFYKCRPSPAVITC